MKRYLCALHGIAIVALACVSSACAAGGYFSSGDAYVVRWQQDVMPITDVSVLGLIVSEDRLRELARQVPIDDEDLAHLRFSIVCESNSEITPHGATVRVSCVVSPKGGFPNKQPLIELSEEQLSTLRELFLKAWEESFRSVYKEAVKSRLAEWETLVAALKNQRREVEALTNELRMRLTRLERRRQAQVTRVQVVAQLQNRIAEYRLKKDELVARREALEHHLREMKTSAKKSVQDAGLSQTIINQLRRALQLEEKRLLGLKQRRDGGQLTDDQVFEAENRVLEARIQLERAEREAAGADRIEALLNELNSVNVELMQIMFAVRESEKHFQDVDKTKSEADEMPSDTAVNQARVEYELTERRLMKLTERLAEVEDSGDNIIVPLTFIRLSK